MEGLRQKLQEAKRARVFKSHDIPSKDFDQVCEALPELRILTLSRDFKDVVISRYFYCRYYWPTDGNLGPLPADLADFFSQRQHLDDTAALAQLIESPIVRRWAQEWRAFEGDFFHPRAVRLRYAGLIDGSDHETLSQFTGHPCPRTASFQRIQVSEEMDTGRKGASRFHRNGRVAQWKEWFTPSQCFELDSLALDTDY